VRGLPGLVLPRGSHGPGATALVRDEAGDLFGYGARDAVVRALAADPAYSRGFGGACTATDLVTLLQTVAGPGTSIATVDGGVEAHPEAASERDLGRIEARLVTAAFAAGWRQVERTGTDIPGILRFRPGTP
jgi:coenzyme F420-0:L-glutamate ligase/coenzyme F420-1:gamma-L-glutamate ligase